MFGPASEEELALLYNAAWVLPFPSIYEGFGFPLLEAMACGVPVITSDTTSIPEVVGEAGITLPPCDSSAVARAVQEGACRAGIMIDGAGIGSAIAANKVRGVRAVMALNTTIARYSREHNGANVLTLGASLLSEAEARDIVSTWLTTPMREPRYIRRLAKIRDLERQ